VIAKGIITAREGEMVVDLPGVIYPEWVCNSVHLAREITQEDFKISANHFPTVQAHVIGIIENQAPTHHLVMTMTVENGEVCADTDQDIAKVALIDRHSGASQVHMGLVHGFGLEGKCAIASTVSHDCHHMMMIGTDENCMALAANTLRECGGGQVVVKDGVVIGKVELPIAGLMSNENARIVAKKAGTVLDGFRTCGCGLNNPNMQLSLLALVVIPELRISDHGLVDVSKFSVIEVLD
jgi:adenine deaminase